LKKNENKHEHEDEMRDRERQQKIQKMLLLFLNIIVAFSMITADGVASSWIQTSQADFELGVSSNVDTATSPGCIILSTAGISYFAFGYFISTIYDCGVSGTDWDSINWSDTKPSGTDIKFQIATSTSFDGPWNFKGASGSSTDWYEPGVIFGGHDGDRYLVYKASFTATDTDVTPELEDVTVTYYTLIPSSFTGVALSTNSVKWSWQSEATNEDGFKVISDTSGVMYDSLVPDATFWIETELNSNTSYYRYAQGYNADGVGNSTPTIRYTLAKLPSNLTGLGLTSFSIELQWSENGGSGFKIEVSTDEENWLYGVDVASSPYTITGLASETTHWFQIKSYNGDGEINNTPGDFLSIFTGPPAPQDFNGLAVSTTSIKWFWTDIANTEDGYRIINSTSMDILKELNANDTYWIEAGLPQPNFECTRHIQAYRISIDSSSSVSNQVIRRTLTDPPENLGYIGRASFSVALSWTAPTYGASSYDVEKATDYTGVWNTVAGHITVSSYTVTELVPETTYWFCIKARNSDETETINDIPSDSTSAATGPYPPINFKGVALSSISIEWMWQDNTNVEDGYRVISDTGGILYDTFSPNTTSWIEETGLSANTSYYHSVQVYASGYDATDSTDSAITYTLSNPPTGLTCMETGLSSISLSWTPGSGGNTKYAIERSSDSNGEPCSWAFIAVWTNDISTTVYTDTDLVEQATYWYRIYGYNGDAEITSPSNEISAYSFGLAPSAITDISALEGTNEGEVLLTWTAPGDDETVGQATAYILKYAISSITDFNWDSAVEIAVSGPSGQCGTLEQRTISLSKGSYYFAIKTLDEAENCSDISNSAGPASSHEIPPAAVNNLSALQGAKEGEIALTWTAPGDDGTSGQATKYIIYYGATSVPDTELTGVSKPGVSGTAETMNTGGFTIGVTYYFILYTEDKRGNVSGVSNKVFTFPRVFTPTGFSGLAVSTTSINWFWTDNAADETSYRVMSSTDGDMSGDLFANATFWVENNLYANMKYGRYCRVFSTAESKNSNQAFVYTYANPPANMTCLQQAGTGATLSWDANSATGFAFEQAATAPTTWTYMADNLSTNSYIVSNLLEGVTYWFRVRGYNGDQIITEHSNEIPVFIQGTPPTGKPSTSTDGGEYADSTSVTFNWTIGNSADPESGISGYYLQIGTHPGMNNMFDGYLGNVFLYRITDCVPSETYYARVRAVNGTGLYGEWSDDSDGIIIMGHEVKSNSITIITKSDGTKVALSSGTVDGTKYLQIKTSLAPPLMVYDLQIKATDVSREVKFSDGTEQLDQIIIITIPYTDVEVLGMDEENLRMFYWEDNQNLWSLILNSQVYPEQNIVVAAVEHLTIFRIMEFKANTQAISSVSNYPNPFYGGYETTKIRYILMDNADVEIKIYDLISDLVWQKKVAKGQSPGGIQGPNEIPWDGKNEIGQSVTSGAYILEIKTLGKSIRRKIAVKR